MRWLPFATVLLASILTRPPAFADTFACSEAGVLAAVEQGGGPHRFDCAEPTTITTALRISIPRDLILDGEGLLTLSGGDRHPVLFVDVGATVELRRLVVTNGRATLNYPCCDGAGIRNRGYLTLVECLVSENYAPYGGGAGIFNSGYISSGQTSLTLIDTTVSNNSARIGGGISSTAGSSLVITGSTISGNEATEFSGGGILSNSFVEITNSTISSNYALLGGGGGISQPRGDLTLTNVTFSGNQPNALGSPFGVVEAANTIFDGVCSLFPTVASLGGNLEGPGDTCGLTDASDQVAVSDLMLAALGDHGGPSDTHALLPGSPAIDVGVDCPPPVVDQRGVSRPQGASCDAGAYEFEVPVILVDVDIRPRSETNPINPMSRGVIPVAILGSDTFDVTDVDATTLAFGPDGAVPAHKKGGHLQDVDEDGFTDLLSHYWTEETGIAGGETEACVTGETLDGTPLEGCDFINTEPNCGNGYVAALVVPPVVWIGGRVRRRRR